MLTDLQFSILQKIAPAGPPDSSESQNDREAKLASRLGWDILKRIAGARVIDFGCGEGFQSIELARLGAAEVIGVDIQEARLERARIRAAEAGVAATCRFVKSTDERADFIVSIDAFEHFEQPLEILALMERLLKPAGEVIACFGPTWLHPHGGHLFSVFPWAHVLFSESALVRWRALSRNDGATRFAEVAGGLNEMTIARFEQIVAASTLKFASFETVPIRPLRLLHNHATREFTTSVVRCRLVKRSAALTRSRAA